MTTFSNRGNQGDHSARLAPLSGRQGALLPGMTVAREQRPVETIAVVRKAAEELA
ncbi:MAG TPA: hypothetical protein VJT49_06375 [Amycolatopsis sp.]|uniref:hypothetical protein n=1 Tax=Amycolatopsis sp. TaxID=37632 RepID=UPI002B47A68F|nr:hypothetical protein [Amycolatopsis sp.]HKS44733.1 hypothetical protein [Amycolatopsis sp.]